MLKRSEAPWAIPAGLKKFGFPLLLAALAALMLLWPSRSGEDKTASEAAPREDAEAHALELERRLEDILARVEGCGSVRVMLTLADRGSLSLAQNTDSSVRSADSGESRSETVVLRNGSSREEVVEVGGALPAFRGALVVCRGGNSPEVVLRVKEAVRSLTGLGTDRITVCAMRDDAEDP